MPGSALSCNGWALQLGDLSGPGACSVCAPNWCSNDKPLIVRYEGQTLLSLADRTTRKPRLAAICNAHRLPRPVHPAATAKGRQLGAVSHQPLRHGHHQLLCAVCPTLRRLRLPTGWARDDRGRDRAGAAALRLSRQRAVCPGADGGWRGAGGAGRALCQGFFGGKTDLAFQRFTEIWGSMPELYLLIIFSAVLSPSIGLLLVLLSSVWLDGAVGLCARRVLRNRQLDYVESRTGAGRVQQRHHLAPHPAQQLHARGHLFAVSHERRRLALTSLDFLGLGVPPAPPAWASCWHQGKNNIDAWWISLSTFGVLVLTLLLLTFMGDALRDALDPRKAQALSVKEGA